MPESQSPLRPPTGDHRLIWDLLLSAQILPAIAVCAERGIFALLAQEPLAVGEAATRLEVTEEWAEILLGVAAALQFVRVQDGKYHLTDTARSFLVPESPFYAGASLRRFAERDVTGLARLHRALDSARPGVERYEVREWKAGELDPRKVEEGVRTLHSLSFPAAVALANCTDFRSVHRLLDVAGGAGGFSIALAQHNPHLHCTVAELPDVCDLTHEYIQKYGVENQVDTKFLNMFFEPWPAGYDAVLLSSVLHDWDHEHRTELLRRALAALSTGGRIFIHEMLLSDAADGPFGAALFSLAMRTGTLGKQFTAPELRLVLEEVGFVDATVLNTYAYFSLMSARKP